MHWYILSASDINSVSRSTLKLETITWYSCSNAVIVCVYVEIICFSLNILVDYRRMSASCVILTHSIAVKIAVAIDNTAMDGTPVRVDPLQK